MTTTNSINLYEKYCAIRSQEDEKRKIGDETDDRIRDWQTREILAGLKANGIPEERVKTNGYSFQFDFNGMRIAFVVQTERVCGEMHRLPQNREEGTLLANKDFVLNRKELKTEFCRAFWYQDFCIDGDPVSAVGKIMAMAVDPLTSFNEFIANENKNRGGSR